MMSMKSDKMYTFVMCTHRSTGMQEVRPSHFWRLWRFVGHQGLCVVQWRWWSRGSISTLSRSFLTQAYWDNDLSADVSLEQRSNDASAGTAFRKVSGIRHLNRFWLDPAYLQHFLACFGHWYMMEWCILTAGSVEKPVVDIKTGTNKHFLD